MREKLKIPYPIIVEGKYDKQRLKELVDAPIITTSGFRVFKDKEKQKLIRKIAESRGILILTDSDSGGFVIRNFLKGIVPESTIKHAYIPQLKGKEKRKAEASKEGLLGVEGVREEVILKALKTSGATVLSENNEIKESEIEKIHLYELGLTGKENSAVIREKLLKKLELPTYLTTNAMLSALNCLYSLKELKEIVNEIN